MIKKLILSLVLFIFMTALALGCILPQGTHVWMFVPADDGVGVQDVFPAEDVIVIYLDGLPKEGKLLYTLLKILFISAKGAVK